MAAPANTLRHRVADFALLVLTSLATLAALCALVRVLRERVALHAVQGGFVRVELALLVVAACLAVAALGLTFADLMQRRGAKPARAFGWLVVVMVIAWAGFLAFAQPFQRVWFELALGAAAGAWAGVLLWLRQAPPSPPRWLRVTERTLVALCVTALLLELGLRVAAAADPSPLLARVGDAPRELIARFRSAPGEVRFGFACNSRGYYDEEWLRRAEGERAVASIGDSFNVGAVPHALHYTTVCERELGLAVHNIGVAGIGPPEYLALLVDEALPLDPSSS